MTSPLNKKQENQETGNIINSTTNKFIKTLVEHHIQQ
jgi:hypothetical protein